MSKQAFRKNLAARNHASGRGADSDEQQHHTQQQPENFFSDMMTSIQPLSLLRAIGDGQKEMINTFHNVHSGGDTMVGPDQEESVTTSRRGRTGGNQQQQQQQQSLFSRSGSSQNVRSGTSGSGEREILPRGRKFPLRQSEQRQAERYDDYDNSAIDGDDENDELYPEEGVDESAFCGNCQCPRNKCPSDCPLGGNKRRDIDVIRLSKGTKYLNTQYGFVGDVADIFDPKLLPFRATECDKILSLVPNTNWTFDEMSNALGVPSNLVNGVIPADFVFANLPGNSSKYNGLYILLGRLGDALKLLRLNWREGSCKSPGVGTLISIRFGATAGTYMVASLPDCNQRWILSRVPLSTILFAEPIHMWANGTKYQFYNEEIDVAVC